MIYEISRIAELQLSYSSENTPEMKERGKIIRQDLPNLLLKNIDDFQKNMGVSSQDLGIEGSDGIGRKTEAPWVRIYSKSLSASATVGFYVVLHFALDGKSFFVTIGCGASRWDNERGDLIKHSDEELSRKVSWAHEVLRSAGKDPSDFPDKISIGSNKPLPKSFEKATILTQKLDPHTINAEKLVDAISTFLSLLAIIYEAYGLRTDLKASETQSLDVQSVINPIKNSAKNRQGYGLTGPERRAVELHAMKLARQHLEVIGYKVTDMSANHSFDFLAEVDGKIIKIEVKGTTSKEVDSILMTANEVELHSREAGATALIIVSGISLVRDQEQISCCGGLLELILPWDISKWTLIPKAYLVAR